MASFSLLPLLPAVSLIAVISAVATYDLIHILRERRRRAEFGRHPDVLTRIRRHCGVPSDDL